MIPDTSPVPGQADPPFDLAAEASTVDHRTVVGRRRRSNTRARIVEAAARVYADKGPYAPVIDDFVKAAGMSRGTFYNHFTTTNELLQATIESLTDELARAVIEASAPFDDPVERAAMATRIHLHWVTADAAVCAFFAMVPKIGEVGRREARVQLRQGMASGVFDVPDVDAACDLVFGMLSETIRRVAKAPGKPKRCNEVVMIILAGLGVPRDKIARAMALPLPALQPRPLVAAPRAGVPPVA